MSKISKNSSVSASKKLQWRSSFAYVPPNNFAISLIAKKHNTTKLLRCKLKMAYLQRKENAKNF